MMRLASMTVLAIFVLLFASMTSRISLAEDRPTDSSASEATGPAAKSAEVPNASESPSASGESVAGGTETTPDGTAERSSAVTSSGTPEVTESPCISSEAGIRLGLPKILKALQAVSKADSGSTSASSDTCLLSLEPVRVESAIGESTASVQGPANPESEVMQPLDNQVCGTEGVTGCSGLGSALVATVDSEARDSGVVGRSLRSAGLGRSDSSSADSGTLSADTTASSAGSGSAFRVIATAEGLIGGRTATGDIIKKWSEGAALPSRKALGRSLSVTYLNNGQAAACRVGDVGPWNTRDPYWEKPQGRPQAETGRDLSGRRTNRAGIDLYNATWYRLLKLRSYDRRLIENTTGEVEWQFQG